MINYVKKLSVDLEVQPQAYWINTSGNELVRRFICKADKTTQNEIERLIAGESIEKKVRLDLTYNEIDNSIDNLWSVLFTTGYLTQLGKAENGVYQLLIPNREVREVFYPPDSGMVQGTGDQRRETCMSSVPGIFGRRSIRCSEWS